MGGWLAGDLCEERICQGILGILLQQANDVPRIGHWRHHLRHPECDAPELSCRMVSGGRHRGQRQLRGQNTSALLSRTEQPTCWVWTSPPASLALASAAAGCSVQCNPCAEYRYVYAEWLLRRPDKICRLASSFSTACPEPKRRDDALGVGHSTYVS